MKKKNKASKRLRFLLVAIVVLAGVVSLIGSGGGGGGPAPGDSQACALQEELELVYGLMADIYLWSDHVRGLNINWWSYTSSEDLLSDLLYKPLDAWSFMMTQKEYDDYFNQAKLTGLGFSLGLDNLDNIRLRYVYSSSPAGLAGLARGDILLEVNGITVDEFTDFEAAFGADQSGLVVNLRVQEIGGDISDLELVKKEYVYDMVQYRDVIEAGGRKIGYLVYQHFNVNSLADLATEARAFNAAGITDLILDLRYNGGGRLDVMWYLGGMITGDDGTGIISEVFYNDRYSNLNRAQTMVDTPAEVDLNLSRLVVITSALSASASEMLINGLEPSIDVVTVGSTTAGKPVGMNVIDICDKKILPITFEVRNSLGDGGYYTGIAPDCAAEDDLTKAWGDQTEDSLSEAVYYILNNQCSVTRSVKAVVEEKTRQIELTGLRKITVTF
jgi:C-terminal processing protease CtpA/Prc